jgi:hypothetical protein
MSGRYRDTVAASLWSLGELVSCLSRSRCRSVMVIPGLCKLIRFFRTGSDGSVMAAHHERKFPSSRPHERSVTGLWCDDFCPFVGCLVMRVSLQLCTSIPWMDAWHRNGRSGEESLPSHATCRTSRSKQSPLATPLELHGSKDS